VSGFSAVRGRTTLTKQGFSKFQSVHCKGSPENQLVQKDTGKHVCPVSFGENKERNTWT